MPVYLIHATLSVAVVAIVAVIGDILVGDRHE